MLSENANFENVEKTAAILSAVCFWIKYLASSLRSHLALTVKILGETWCQFKLGRPTERGEGERDWLATPEISVWPMIIFSYQQFNLCTHARLFSNLSLLPFHSCLLAVQTWPTNWRGGRPPCTISVPLPACPPPTIIWLPALVQRSTCLKVPSILLQPSDCIIFHFRRMLLRLSSSSLWSALFWLLAGL